MATNNKLQIAIDFIVNLKSDPGKLASLVSEVSTMMKDVKIDINSDEVKKEITNIVNALGSLQGEAGDIEKAFSGLNIDLNTAEAEQKIGAVVDSINKINDVDLTGLEKAFEKAMQGDFTGVIKEIEKNINDVDATKFSDSISALAVAFDKAKKETLDLLETQKLALKALEANGQQGSASYKKLESEIAKTTEEVKKFSEELSNTNADSFTDIMSKFEAIGQFGEKLTSMSEAGIEFRDTLNNVAGQIGVSGEGMEKLKRQSIDAFSNGIGNSVAEATKALGTAKQLLGNVLDDNQLMDFAKGAAAIGQVFDKDINEVIGGSRTFITQFGLDGQKAFELLGFAMQKSGSKMDDTLDTLDEYSVLVKKAGYSASEFVGVLTNGMQQGSRDTDKLGDAIKETNIRLMEGDISTELTDAVSKFGTEMPSALKKTLQGIVEAGQAGKLSTKEVLQQTSTSIMESFNQNEISGVLRDKLARSVSGTMAEDMGGEMWTKIFSAPIDTATIEAQAKTAGEQISNALGPVTTFEKFKRQMTAVWTDMSMTIAPYASQLGGALQQVASIAPAITLFKEMDFAKMGKGITDSAKGISDFASKIVSLFVPSIVAQTTVTEGATVAQAEMNTTMLANPAVLIAAGVIVLIGALALFFTQTEKGKEVAASIGQAFTDFWHKLTPVVDGLIAIGEATMKVMVKVGEVIWEMFIMPIEMAVAWIEMIVNWLSSLGGSAQGNISIFQMLGEVFKDVAKTISTLGDAIGLISVYIKAAKDFITGFISVIPDLLGTVGEYMSYYLNPVNFFNPDKSKEQELSDKMANVINKAMGKARDTLTNSKVDLSLDKMMEIKGNLDKQGKIDELVKKFGEAKSDIDKKNIADEIAKQVPGAVNGYKDIIDAQGNVVQMADINIAKVKELSEANKKTYTGEMKENQKSFIEGLTTQATEYENNKIKLKQLADDMVKASAKGQDTSKIKADYQKLQTELVSEQKNINKELENAGKIGIPIDGIKFGDNFNKDFTDGISKLATKAEEMKLGDKIGQALTIKGNLDQQDKLGALVEKFKNSSNAVEKASIGEKIKKINGDVIKSDGLIVDSNGKAVQSYSLTTTEIGKLTDKKKESLNTEFIQKQNEITDGITKEGTAYSETYTKYVAKIKEINEAKSQGKDTTGLEQELNSLGKNLDTQQKMMIGNLAKSKQAGTDTSKQFDTVSKSIGKSTDEVKKMVDKQIESDKLAKNQAASVTTLAKAWDEAKAALSKNLTEQKSAYLEMDKEIAALQKKPSSTRTEEEQAQIIKLNNSRKDTLKLMVDEVKQNKLIAKEEENLAIKIGEKDFDYMKALNDQYGIKKNHLELDQKTFELGISQKILSEKRASDSYDEFQTQRHQLDILAQQKQGYIDIAKQKGIIQSINPDGTVNFSTKIKKADRGDIENAIQDMNKSITESKIKINDLKAKIKLDESKLQQDLIDLTQSKLEFQMEIGLTEKGDYSQLLNLFKKQGNDTEKQLKENTEKLKAAKDNQNKVLSELDAKLSKINIKSYQDQYAVMISEANKTNDRVQEITKKMNTEIADLGKKATEKDVANIQTKYLKQIEAAQKGSVTYKNVISTITKDLQAQGLEINEIDLSSIFQQFETQVKFQETITQQIREKIKYRNDEIKRLTKEGKISEAKNLEESMSEQIKTLQNKTQDYGKVYEKLQNDLLGSLTNLPDDTKQAIATRFKSLISNLQTENNELNKTNLDQQKNLLDTYEKSITEKLSVVEDEYKREQEIRNSSYEEQSKKAEEFYSKLSDLSSQQLDVNKQSAIDSLDKQKEEELKRIDSYAEMEALSKEDSEKRKSDIEEKYSNKKLEAEKNFAEKRLIIEQTTAGALLELSRQNDLKEANLQKDKAEKSIKKIQDDIQKQTGMSEAQYNELVDIQKKYYQSELEYQRDSSNEKAKADMDSAKKLMSDKEKGLTESNKTALEGIAKTMADADKVLKDKGDLLTLGATMLGETLSTSITQMFSGKSLTETADSWRAYFSQLAGILQAQATAAVLKLILSDSVTAYLSAIPFPFNLVALAAAKEGITLAVKGITDPLIGSLLSFSTGGQVDEPTLAVIGDASNLGSQNREWIFRNDQLHQVINMASVGSNQILEKRLANIENLLASQQLTTTLTGQNINIALKRTDYQNGFRSR